MGLNLRGLVLIARWHIRLFKSYITIWRLQLLEIGTHTSTVNARFIGVIVFP